MRIGQFDLQRALLLAPMAGITDAPFRRLCRQQGAGAAISEMVSSDRRLRFSRKTSLRLDHRWEPSPIVVQIVGVEPQSMAEAARHNVDTGAQIIDINMGCPAKKVCNKLAGSALLRDEKRVAKILDAVVSSVDEPVTLKIRTGWSPDTRNALTIAKIAESAGIQTLSIHGRTRACGFAGKAEYETIRRVKERVEIPVIANGDIDSPEKAARVLQQTGADGLMVGRAARGRPWLFARIKEYLDSGNLLPEPGFAELMPIIIRHLSMLYEHYGEASGVRISRKHVHWYLQDRSGWQYWRQRFNKLEDPAKQLQMIADYFDERQNNKSLAA